MYYSSLKTGIQMGINGKLIHPHIEITSSGLNLKSKWTERICRFGKLNFSRNTEKFRLRKLRCMRVLA